MTGPARGLPTLLVICGPTGAGKSAIAMRLARRHPVTIVSADSRQVYRGFDVGTAKPTPAERADVPHVGVDVAEPTERYSASTWAESAEGWIADARAAGRVPVIVTRKKYVRKPRKGPPGLALCTHEKTVMVRPTEPPRTALADLAEE